MKIDLGCGTGKKAGFVGVDVADLKNIYPPGQFVKADLFNKIPFDDNSIEEVYARHFIEHIPREKVIWFFNEIYRILIIGRIFEIYFPPTQSPDGKACRGAFCDPTHMSYWNDLSFRYFDMRNGEKIFAERYGIKCNFKVIENKFIDEHNHHTILEKVCLI